MPVYSDVIGNEYHLQIAFNHTSYYKDKKDEPDGITRLRFIYKDELHRTDGPALVTWDENKTGLTRIYYLEGTMLEPEDYLRVLMAPLRDLPLYLNNYPYSLIAKDRLAGARTELDLKIHSTLEPEIQKRIWYPTPKQVLIKNLCETINRAVFKQVQNMKPFRL